MLRLNIKDTQERFLLDPVDSTISPCTEAARSKTAHSLVKQQDQLSSRMPNEHDVGMRFWCAGYQAALWFPMSIRLTIGQGGSPDFYLQAFQFVAGLPLESFQNINLRQRGFFHLLRRCFSFFKRIAAMALIHFLLPGVVPTVQKVVCISSLIAVLAKATPFLKSLVVEPLKDSGDLDQHGKNGVLTEKGNYSLERMGTELLNRMVTSTLLLYSTGAFWRFLHPESYHLLQCSMALVEINKSYKKLSRAVRKGKIIGEIAIEQAWLNAHKKAAQRVAHLQKDLPDVPPLKHLIEFWERSHFQMGYCSPVSSTPVRYLTASNSLSMTWTLETVETVEMNVRYHVRQEMMVGNRVSRSRYSLQRKTFPEIHECPLEAELDLLSEDDDNSSLNEELQTESKSSPENIESMLYGRNDHLHEEKKLSAAQKVELTVRGVQLFLAFLPFLLFGIFLLIVASFLDPGPRMSSSSSSSSSTRPKQSLQNYSRRKQGVNALRLAAFEKLLKGCRESGAAFIKWGQWSASREDLFPSEFCDVLSELHDQAPMHSISATRREILKAYGRPLEEIFDSFEYKPLASGSVAQVHRAIYRWRGKLTPVIVKVRHPNVGDQISQDFQILKPLAGLAERISMLKNFSLKESVSQFSSTMTAQTNFRVEAAHLQRFWENFLPYHDSIVIPRVIPELISESVLVESYEEGKSVSHFMKKPSKWNTKIVTLGVDAYLKMLLSDNFIHTDLHPGNILVREAELENGEKKLQIVLLDFGLAEELKPNIRKHFISFLNMISKGDGYAAARHLLQWSENQNCPHPDAFAEDMHSFFATHCDIRSESGIDLDHVMKSVLRLARKHGVSIDSSYASMVIGVCIIVGFAQALDPRVNLMDAATPVLLTYSLTGRIVGRLYG